MHPATAIAILLDQLEELHPLESETTHVNCATCNNMRAAYKVLFKLNKEEK
jgi:hypothetical protein